ncbi:FliM/FliN family flagellar motor switch protein [Photobacterium kishitanii]|uniref:Flagellar motor switch protein FliN-like C-terminal domain-containing protein n=1 Tax=Photobacterium kishitanii TaxID=318456 RepID=A0A2T3KMS2_9GAMM|nr:FliM/FliN family flagellar motor C-terminal domain-containing protein [Photobacterium kishitanii]PSV01107.1 hypothetical protein C9J27_03550 [Photobacterium kishitanii]
MSQNVANVKNIKLDVSVEIGRTQMTLSEIEESVKSGTQISLNTKVGEGFVLMVNGSPVATGTVEDVDGELCFVTTEVIDD